MDCVHKFGPVGYNNDHLLFEGKKVLNLAGDFIDRILISCGAQLITRDDDVINSLISDDLTINLDFIIFSLFEYSDGIAKANSNKKNRLSTNVMESLSLTSKELSMLENVNKRKYCDFKVVTTDWLFYCLLSKKIIDSFSLDIFSLPKEPISYPVIA